MMDKTYSLTKEQLIGMLLNSYIDGKFPDLTATQTNISKYEKSLEKHIDNIYEDIRSDD